MAFAHIPAFKHVCTSTTRRLFFCAVQLYLCAGFKPSSATDTAHIIKTCSAVHLRTSAFLLSSVPDTPGACLLRTCCPCRVLLVCCAAALYCLVPFCLQYYFETIFPRIPKKVEDDIQAELRRRGLPTKGKGNGGCGGTDRRGGDDGNRRPASVKASLSVAFGQRAPNRAGTKTWKDERIKAVAGDSSRDKGRDCSRDGSRDPAAADEGRGVERGAYGRSSSREGPRERYDSRDKERERESNGRDYDSRRGDR